MLRGMQTQILTQPPPPQTHTYTTYTTHTSVLPTHSHLTTNISLTESTPTSRLVKNDALGFEIPKVSQRMSQICVVPNTLLNENPWPVTRPTHSPVTYKGSVPHKPATPAVHQYSQMSIPLLSLYEPNRLLSVYALPYLIREPL